MSGLRFKQKLRAVQLLRLTQAVHTISCILFTYLKPVKCSCVIGSCVLQVASVVISAAIPTAISVDCRPTIGR